METRVRLVFLGPEQLVVRKLVRGLGARHWLLAEEFDVSEQLGELAQAFAAPAPAAAEGEPERVALRFDEEEGP
jgi:hypothetical protein